MTFFVGEKAFGSSLVTRFAPSPTGALHLGHAYAAKVAHDLALNAGGHFFLRFEDIDHTRVRPEFYTAIEMDLQWLGFAWQDTPWRQCERLGVYQDALDKLIKANLAYPCFCTRREIQAEVERLASAPHGPPPDHYPGLCRDLSAKDREARIDAGQIPAWRLNSARALELAGPLSFYDHRFGRQQVGQTPLEDIVLARKDLGTSYHLAVVVDDAAQGITLVTRGEDLLESTPYHRLLQSILRLPEPEYYHHELIRDIHGQRLATRSAAHTLAHFREQGLSAKEVLAQLPPLC